MEAGFIVLSVLAIVAGVIVGMLVGKKRAERRYLQDTQYSQGTLNVDCSESEVQPGLFLALWVPAKEITSRKYVTLDVNVILRNSHK